MIARYICIEGIEGVGKTTQAQKLVDYLRAKGFKVLQTKEPGTSHAPLTMELRNIMLNAKYEDELTRSARELVSQAIRSIHLEKVIVPAFNEYDFIIQDRGTLSGVSYGEACGNELKWLNGLLDTVCRESTGRSYCSIYDDVVYLKGNVKASLLKATTSKQEFEAGDAMEKLGITFMEVVDNNMEWHSKHFRTKCINIDNKDIDQVFGDILEALELK